MIGWSTGHICFVEIISYFLFRLAWLLILKSLVVTLDAVFLQRNIFF